MNKKPERPLRWQIFSNVSDLMMSIGSAILIMLLVLILSSLIRWVMDDFETTFAGLTRDFNDAVLVEEAGEGAE